MEFLTLIKTGGILGFLFGLFFVSWVNPGTVEGQLLLLIVCVAVGVLFSGALGTMLPLLKKLKEKKLKFKSLRRK